MAQMQAQARKPGKIERNEGDIDAALKGAAKVIEHEYYIPHSVHAPMEPPAAVVQIKDGKAVVWACVQSPGGTRGDVAKQLGMKEEDVTVNVTLLGGGFGRKSKCDFALEAAILSKAMGGIRKVVVDARRRHPAFLLSQRFVPARDRGPRQEQQGRGWRHRSRVAVVDVNFMPDPKRETLWSLVSGHRTSSTCRTLRLETGEAVSHTRIGCSARSTTFRKHSPC